ncbi:hypothetical protein GCM10027200_70780 [Lentzea nigeriaca]
MNAASHMCTNCAHVDGPNMAAHGRASTTPPCSSSRNIVASTHPVLRAMEISGLDAYLPMSRSISEAVTSIELE